MGDDCCAGEPEIVCTLDSEQVPERLEEWQALRSRIVTREPIDGGLRLHLEREPGLAAEVLDLVEREQQCCAFFTFAVRVGSDGLALDVTAPPEAVALVEELVG